MKAKNMDAVYLAPGTDFRKYTKVMLDPPEVAFEKNWQRDINDSRVALSRKVSDEDAASIAARARTGLQDVFEKEFSKAGVQVVSTPGAHVVRLSTSVIYLYINAPDTMSPGRVRTYTTEAGEATLVMEARDSTTGALLGRVLDRRETQRGTSVQWATSVSNSADFRRLSDQWARISIKGMNELKAHSPVPADLKPNTKL